MGWPDEDEVELGLGETIQIGALRVTLAEIDGNHICFHIEGPDCDPEWLQFDNLDGSDATSYQYLGMNLASDEE